MMLTRLRLVPSVDTGAVEVTDYDYNSAYVQRPVDWGLCCFLFRNRGLLYNVTSFTATGTWITCRASSL